MLINLHDGSLVATAVTIVGGTKDSDHIAIVAPIVTLQKKKKRYEQLAEMTHLKQ